MTVRRTPLRPRSPELCRRDARRRLELARRVGAHEDVDAVVNDTAQATVLVMRDPDGIQIEICSWKTQDSG